MSQMEVTSSAGGGGGGGSQSGQSAAAPVKSPLSRPSSDASNSNSNTNQNANQNTNGNTSNSGQQNQNVPSVPSVSLEDRRPRKEPENERPPQWRIDLMMEKLRQKNNQFKIMADTSKNIRQALMERRCVLDYGDKSSLQRSLDSLQQSIKVNSLQSMVERLEMVARQLGLKFHPGATGHEWFISSDMFYLELLIDPNGVVEDVKIQHDGKTEQQSCPEIVESLKRTDFAEFTAHLEGLVSIYQLNADKKIKSKAYIALQALETDLSLMASTYRQVSDAEAVVMKSLLGLVQPRKGGHPVKLVYFISPYEFLDVKSKTTLPNDLQTVINKKLGHVATVSIQASTSHKLQMSTTVNVTRTPDGKSIPHYGALNATNSTALPACFMVNLGKPMPICIDLLKAMQTTTKIDTFDFSNPQPILNLVAQQTSNGTLNCSMNKGLFVALPDQVHCYFMTETPNLEGIMVSTISFTLASQLPQVIAILRQQLAFNTLIGSCVRVGSKPELDNIVFEVNALSHQKISVSFQHPLDDSLVTLEFDLRDVTHPHCHLHAVANATDIIPTLEEHACRVVKRSMSIPITLRAVIRRWQSMKVKADPPNPDFSVAVGGSGMNMDMSRLTDRSCGAESGDRRSSSGHMQNVVIPPGIMNFNNASTNNPKHPISTTATTQSSSSSYSISPIFPAQPQNPMDILSYMNPFLNLSGNSQFPPLTPNMAIQMLASQMGQNPSMSNNPMLMGLLDQVGQQTQKRRKRKNTSDTLPSPKQSPQHSMRPNQSPSRSSSTNKSPISRRQSDSSDGGGSNADNKSHMSMLMNELGMDNLPDSRWNIDITPVSTSAESMDDLDSFKKHANKKTTPKRSISLDSHSSEDISGIQSLLDTQDFKPLMTPSLSITPVSTTSSNVKSLLDSIRPGIEIIPLPNPPAVNIPTSLTVTPILSSSGGKSTSGGNDRQQENKFNKKSNNSKDRNAFGSSGSGGKRKLDGNDGDMSRPSKIPFLDSKGRVSPNINMTKKPSSPNVSPSKQVPTSQGKPSVSTLKSVSSSNSNSPKYSSIDSSSSSFKQKIKKPHTNKAVKNLMNIGSIPQLKALSPEISSLMPGGSNNKMDGTPNTKLDPSKGDIKLVNQVQMASAAVTAALQQAAASLVASSSKPAQSPQPVKKGGLAAVIDKLKSGAFQSSSDGPITTTAGSGGGGSSAGTDKKDSVTTMSTKDYLKVSSAITNDVMQQKKALSGTTVMTPGTQGSGGIPGQEYMVKGGQGLKLTINKAKLKDPTKSPKLGSPGLKSPLSGMKKVIPGMKPLSALSAKLASVTKKPVTPTKELMKDLAGLKAGILQSNKSKDGSGGSNKPRLESEDLTKKLFLPGAVKSLEAGVFSQAPVFDPNKFQIPKKSRSNPNNGSSSAGSTSSSSNTSAEQKSSSSESMISSTSSSISKSFSSSSVDTISKEKAHSNISSGNNNLPAPIPMEVDAPAPELVAESSSTLSSSNLTNRTEPPSLIDSSNSKASDAGAGIPMDLGKTEPDSTTATASQSSSNTTTTKPELSTVEDLSQADKSAVVPTAEDFASPESPDPVSGSVNTSIIPPQNIPTMSLNPSVVAQEREEPSKSVPPVAKSITPPPVVTPSPVSASAPAVVSSASKPVAEAEDEDNEEDQDQLFIDDGSSEKSSSAANTLKADKLNDDTSTSVDSTKEKPEEIENSVPPPISASSSEEKSTPEMPPPPPPVVETSSSAAASIKSPAPPSPLAPPASPKAVASPLGNTVSIASAIHIVHSPQPNSPALLRSPLVAASPSAASPYAIDDDLMDEALIGGSGGAK